MTGTQEMRRQQAKSRRRAKRAASASVRRKELLKEKEFPKEKKFPKGFSIGLLLLLLLLFSVSAAAGYFYTARYKNTTEVSANAPETGSVRILENCNIRSGPGTASEVIGGGKKDQVFEYAGKTETAEEGVPWYSIDYNGTIAWVSKAVAELDIDE